MHGQLDHYKKLWGLSDDGDPFTSYSGLLQPVLCEGVECMIKIARREKDKQSNRLMAWWNGTGAAPVLRYDETAILMERATGELSLSEMAKNGRADEASLIICLAVARLHAHPGPYPEFLIPLDQKFGSLRIAARRVGGIFAQCLEIADQLLAEPQEIVALHGDIHHSNVLDFGEKGWLAIDPKGLTGERGFDYANIFCNPDKATAIAPGRLEKQVRVVSEAAGLDPKRLLQWIASWAGLSAAWSKEDGDDSGTAITVAGIALNKLRDIS
ncbi:MAG: 3'-kinase [Bacteroidetes bacterium]|nr:3'-kinase [Bacteroidota bacterium]